MNDTPKTHDRTDAARRMTLITYGPSLAMVADERQARRNQAEAKRRTEPLTIDEIRVDLRSILRAIEYRSFTYLNGGRRILQAQTHILTYVEGSAVYGMQDYPRDFEDDPVITALWDSLDRVRTSARAWRRGFYPGEGNAVIASIMRISQAAADGLPAPFQDDETDAASADFS